MGRHEASARAPHGWRLVLEQLETDYTCTDFTTAGHLAARIAALADEQNHHPDITLRFPGVVHVRTTSHDVGGITERDLRLIETLDEAAAQVGATGDAASVQVTEIGIDALDIPAVQAFWQAAMDYDPDGARPGHLSDPRGSGPTLWFQQMDEPRPQRNRVHLDVWVPHDVLEGRLSAALEAGGRLLTDEYAPSFWVLADPEGNEVCLCTWQERD